MIDNILTTIKDRVNANGITSDVWHDMTISSFPFADVRNTISTWDENFKNRVNVFALETLISVNLYCNTNAALYDKINLVLLGIKEAEVLLRTNSNVKLEFVQMESFQLQDTEEFVIVTMITIKVVTKTEAWNV